MDNTTHTTTPTTSSLPDEVQQTRLLCADRFLHVHPLIYTQGTTNVAGQKISGNWNVMHISPTQKIRDPKKYVERKWGVTKSKGGKQALMRIGHVGEIKGGEVLRISVGAIDWDASTGKFRFSSPWSPGKECFRHCITPTQEALGAIDKEGPEQRPLHQWYRSTVEVGDRLWYETDDVKEMVGQVKRYVEILESL